MRFTKNLVMVAILLCSVWRPVSAQTEPIWKTAFDGDVVYTKSTEVGILLVGTSDFMLYGIESSSGKKLWQTELLKGASKVKGPDMKNLGAERVFTELMEILEDEEVPEIGQFAEVKYNDGFSKNYFVLNIKTGQEVVSPKLANMPVQKVLGKEINTFNYNGTAYLPELRSVLFSASYVVDVKKDIWNEVTKLVALPSAKVTWETDAIAIDAFPFITENGDMILAGKTKIARLDGKTGKTKWEYNTPSKKETFESFDLSLDLTTGYFFEKRNNNGYLVAVNMQNGGKLWEVEMKLKVIPSMTATGYGVVVIDDGKFTLYDLANGKPKWSVKKIDGNVVDLGTNGIAVTSKGKQLKLLNKETGETIWDEKISGIAIDQICATGIMYTDDKGRLGLINYDGNKVWDKKGMLSVPSLRYRAFFDKELMLIDGTLYEVNLLKGDYKVLVAGLSKMFQGDESPEQIMLIEGGYLITSSNNMIMLETDGKVRWQQYWKAPGLSMAAKIALRAVQAAATYAAARSSVSSGMSRSPYGAETAQSKAYAQQADAWNAVAGMAGAMAQQKFKATLSKGDIVMVLSLVGEGGQKNASGLVKVDRRTGSELGRLLLSDKEPMYDYDAITGQIFYKSDKKTIVSYKF
jgi:outer membrane protein assembly factor BamB